MTLHRYFISALSHFVHPLLLQRKSCRRWIERRSIVGGTSSTRGVGAGVWIRLFDGQTLMGWEKAGGNANWRVEEGALVADSGDNSLLCTTVPFRDYEIIAEFRCADRTNSGLFFVHLPSPPIRPKIVLS